MPVAMTDRDRAILDFERGWWLLPSSKAAAIRDRLDLSPTRYYQVLNRLIDDPDAARLRPPGGAPPAPGPRRSAAGPGSRAAPSAGHGR